MTVRLRWLFFYLNIFSNLFIFAFSCAVANSLDGKARGFFFDTLKYTARVKINLFVNQIIKLHNRDIILYNENSIIYAFDKVNIFDNDLKYSKEEN